MTEAKFVDVVRATSPSSTFSFKDGSLANLSIFVNSTDNKYVVTRYAQRLKELGQVVKNIEQTRDVVLVLYQFKTEEHAVKCSLSESDFEAASTHATKCYKIVSRCRLLRTSPSLYLKLENLMENVRRSLSSYSRIAAETGRSHDIISLVRAYPSLGSSDEGISFLCERLVDGVNFEISSQSEILKNEPAKEIPFIFSYSLQFLDMYFPDLSKFFEQVMINSLVRSINAYISTLVKSRLITFISKYGTGDLLEEDIEKIVLIGRACTTFCEELQARTRVRLHGHDTSSSVCIDPSIQQDINVLCSVYITNEIRVLRQQYSKIIQHIPSQGLIDAACVHDIFYIMQRSILRARATGWSKSVEAIVRDLSEVLKDFHGRILQTSSVLPQNLEPTSLSELGALIIQGYVGIQSFLSRSGVSSRVRIAIISELVVDFSTRMSHSLDSIVDERSLDNIDYHSLGEVQDLRQTTALFERLSMDLTNVLAQDSLGLMKQILNELSLAQYILSEERYEMLGDSKVWAQPLIWLTEQLVKALGHECAIQNCTTWLSKFLDILTARLCMTIEMTLFANLTFNQLGVLRFERELRILVAGLSNVTQTSVRITFSRLLNGCRILSVDSITDIADFWDNSSRRLLEFNLDESFQVLSRRVDFTDVMVKEALDNLTRGERK